MTSIAFMIDKLGFQNAEKRLDRGIIPAGPLARHALNKPMVPELFAKCRTRIRNTAIRMKDKTLSGRRLRIARLSAVITISWLNELLSDQPATIRLNIYTRILAACGIW